MKEGGGGGGGGKGRRWCQKKNECFLSLCVWKLYRVFAVLLPGGVVEGYHACRQLHGGFFVN